MTDIKLLENQSKKRQSTIQTFELHVNQKHEALREENSKLIQLGLSREKTLQQEVQHLREQLLKIEKQNQNREENYVKESNIVID